MKKTIQSSRLPWPNFFQVLTLDWLWMLALTSIFLFSCATKETGEPPRVLDEREVLKKWDFGMHTKGVNKFYDTLLLVKLEPNPHSKLNSILQQRVVRDKLYLMTEDKPGQVFKYGLNGEFFGLIGDEPDLLSGTGCNPNVFKFDVCHHSDRLFIANNNLSTIDIYSPGGKLVETREPEFYFIDFVYFSNSGDFLFLILQPKPGFPIEQHHKLYFADSDLNIVDSLFPFTPGQLHRELGITRALKPHPENPDIVYFADMVAGDIFKIEDNGNKTLAYKLVDGIENREDSLIVTEPMLAAKHSRQNLSFYAIHDYFIGKDLIAIKKNSLDGPLSNLIFSRQYNSGLDFATGQYMTGPFLNGREYMFHFGIIHFMKGDTIGTILWPDLWSFFHEKLTDSQILTNHFDHIPADINAPILKMAVLKDAFFGEEAEQYAEILREIKASDDFESSKNDFTVISYTEEVFHIPSKDNQPEGGNVLIRDRSGKEMASFPIREKFNLTQNGFDRGTYIYSVLSPEGEKLTSHPFIFDP